LSFSALNRTSFLTRLQSEHFDLIVIGGGITGAGIALDAASRGLKTALVEKMDFAYGTSSRSTKLIHGGLRYLKQLEFGLVKEVGSERAVVHKLAPHLVVPEKMLLPLSEKKGLGYWLTSIGLKVYDLLAGVKAEDQRRMLTRAQTLKHEPLLRKDDIKGGAIYAEYRTDDARLTIEIIKTAVRYGAVVANYAFVTDFLYVDRKVKGVKVNDILTDSSFTLHGTAIVNAAGPWVDQLREINKSKEGKSLHLTKGVHIVLPRERLPVHPAIYFDVEQDNRMIFAIPRGRTTYVGTTDTNYAGDQDHVVTSREDAGYLIKAVNAAFPSVNLNVNDIESSWAGLRPLIHEEGKSASELSRKDEIFISDSELISIAGGKLTGYRKMAERVVDLVAEKYFAGKELKPCETENIRLAVSPFISVPEVKQYEREVFRRIERFGFPKEKANYLVETFGKDANAILARFEATPYHDAERGLLLAQLDFCLTQEMVVSLSDFFVRRAGLLYFDIGLVLRYKDEVASALQQAFSWSEQYRNEQLKNMDMLISEALFFKR
jgi:glycerol-3-phosphate dehydrogenase